jgi:hypothetical protein
MIRKLTNGLFPSPKFQFRAVLREALQTFAAHTSLDPHQLAIPMARVFQRGAPSLAGLVHPH